MAPIKRGDQWHYRKLVLLPDGLKRRIFGTPMVNTKIAAERAEREHVERLISPPPEAPKERRKFKAVSDEFMRDHSEVANKCSEIYSKRNILDRYVLPEIGAMYIDDIRKPTLLDLRAKMRRRDSLRGGKLSAKTCNNAIQVVHKILRWAHDMEWLDVAPRIKKLPVDEGEMRALSDVELAALLEAAKDEPQWRAAILLGADCGMRQGEIRGLPWDLYATATAEITVARSRWRGTDGSPKSRKLRCVPVTARLTAALHGVRDSKLRGAYVLSQLEGKRAGRPLGVDAMNGNLTRLCRKAGIVPCGWHALRHTYCSRLAMLGVPARTIQELAGHSSLSTTMRYMHLATGEKQRAVALLEAPPAGRGTAVALTDERAGAEGDPPRRELATLTGFEPVLLA